MPCGGAERGEEGEGREGVGGWLEPRPAEDFQLQGGASWAREVVSPHLAVVVFLPLVREHGADDHPRVFDDHFPGFDGSLAEQTATVNG